MSGGRPAIKRSGTKAALVEAMAQYGVPQDEIAAKIGMSVDTMVKLYKQELITGRTNANVKIGKRLFDKAMSLLFSGQRLVWDGERFKKSIFPVPIEQCRLHQHLIFPIFPPMNCLS